MYSDSGMKSSLETTSARDLTARLPLQSERGKRERKVTERNIGKEISRLLALHLDKRALCEVVRVELGFHDVVDRCHLLLRRPASVMVIGRHWSPGFKRPLSDLDQAVDKVPQPSIDRVFPSIPGPASEQIVIYRLLIHSYMLGEPLWVVVEEIS